MKKFLTFVFALSVIFYLSNVSTFAQGKGIGQGPAVTGAHCPDTNHGSSDHGKSADQTNTNHDQTKSTNGDRLIDRINTDTKFRDRLTALLPAGNTMSLPDLAKGFKNQGQFVAFLHVSKNLNLSLDDWKKMWMSMSNGGSLGKSVQDLNLHLSQTQINVQVQSAEKQAKEDLKTKTNG